MSKFWLTTLARFEQNHVLTAYPRSERQRGGDGVGRFLCFYKEDVGTTDAKEGEAVVVIWGKDPKYYTTQVLKLLKRLADLDGVVLHSTLPAPGNKVLPQGVKTHGHLNPEEWQELLRGATHMLGLGDPLLGPSGIDAIAQGCVLINPKYRKPKRGWMSQHGFVEEFVEDHYHCTVDLEDWDEVEGCLRRKRVSRGLIPQEFTKDAYSKRVEDIFRSLL